MKRKVLLGFTFFSFLEVTLGQTANKIDVIDTRSVNDAPTTFSHETRFHFKQSSVVGLPTSAYYSGVMTFAPWGDNSGNKHHQIGFNETGLFWRTGQPQSSSWDSWNRLVTTDANGNVGLGLSDSPTSILDVNGTVTFRRQGSTTAGLAIVDGGALSLRGWGSYNPYIEWVNSSNIRQGYFGWNTDRLSLALENGFNFTIENGNVGIGITNPAAKLHVDGYTVLGHAYDAWTSFGSLNGGRIRGSNEGYLYLASNPNGTGDKNIYYETQAGYNHIMLGGNVGIGTTTPGSFKLAVNGKVWAQEVQVALTNPGPDYVFEPNYKLLSLEEIKAYIDQHKHLPEVPSAKEMETNGVNVSEMNMLLLKKIEELTLYVIELKKENIEIKAENERQNQLMKSLKYK